MSLPQIKPNAQEHVPCLPKSRSEPLPILGRSTSMRRGISFKLKTESPEESNVEPKTKLEYQKIKKLGEGSGGAVYLAIFRGMEVAVKEIYLCKRDGLYEYRMGKVMEELRAHQRLDHPNVVKFIEGEIQPDKIAIITAYQERGSLLQYIKTTGPTCERLALYVTLQLLEALSYVHSKGIIHRDIKAANILITRDDTVQMADFGVSVHQIHSAKTCVNSRFFNGSLHWMAPELFLEDAYDCRVDTWALGCTIVEMLTGKVPFVDQYPDIYSFYMGFGKPLEFEIPSSVRSCEGRMIKFSDPLHAFLKRILVPDWKERPSCQEILYHINEYEWLNPD